MPDQKTGTSLETDGTYKGDTNGDLQDRREAQMKMLRRIEDLIAEAHGIKQPTEDDQNEGSGSSGTKSLREHIKELSELMLTPQMDGK